MVADDVIVISVCVVVNVVTIIDDLVLFPKFAGIRIVSVFVFVDFEPKAFSRASRSVAVRIDSVVFVSVEERCVALFRTRVLLDAHSFVETDFLVARDGTLRGVGGCRGVGAS